MGGLGFRDSRDFNIALLAKQSWRILIHTDSLLAKVYKAKYFNKTSLLEATRGRNSSYAWKSIYQGNQLLSKGLLWKIGNGKNVRAWKDNWLGGENLRPATGTNQFLNPDLRVSDLMVSGTNIWNVDLLNQIVVLDDVPAIKLIKPSVRGLEDHLIWAYAKDGIYYAYAKDGIYYVKSGYHLMHSSALSSHNRSSKVFKSLWSLNIPPKIKQFWWRIRHNSLHVSVGLKRRGMRIDASCQLCGDQDEDVNHLLFQCRV